MRPIGMMLGPFLLLSALSLSIAVAQDATPDVAERPAMVMVFDQNGDIYLTDFQHPAVNLTNSPTWERLPLLSPDGSEIAFVSSEDSLYYDQYKLEVMTLKTGRIRQLTNLKWSVETEMAWSPKGDFLAVALSGLFIVDTQLGTAQQIADYGHSPSWSPDEQQVAYESDGILYVIDQDGQHRQQLTEDGPLTAGYPAFSPVRNEIAYRIFDEDGTAISLIDLDTQTTKQLTPMLKNTAYRPYWSPDGQSIALELDSFDGSIPGSADVYVMSRDGSNLHSVTAEKYDGFVSWFSNSHFLLYWAGLADLSGGSYYAVNVLDGSRTLMSDPTLDTLTYHGN